MLKIRQPTHTNQLKQVTARWRTESLKAAVEMALQQGLLANSFLLSDSVSLCSGYVQQSKAIQE